MKLLKLAVILVLIGGLWGCTKDGKFVAKHTTVTEVSRTLRDFSGIHGYRITYSNESDTSASYRIYIGSTSRMMPGEVETVYEGNLQSHSDQHEDPSGDIKHRKNRRSYKGVKTTERPPEEVITNWNVSIQLSQHNDHVRIFAKASGGFNPIKHVWAFFELLEFQGIQVKRL